jgi:hypothetical protein
MKGKSASLAVLFLASFGARSASAGTTWASASTDFDYGALPSVALSVDATSAYEVHEDAGWLWFSTGTPTDGWNWTFGASSRYASGVFPSIANLAPDPAKPDRTYDAIEVHQGQIGPGPLWYTLHGQDGWSPTRQYDSGYRPQIASVFNLVVEVHQAGTALGPLWYRTGFDPDGAGSYTWSNSVQYSFGIAPSVGVGLGTGGEYLVVEVEQQSDGVGPLYYRVGIVSRDTKTIAWSDPRHYDDGSSPSICVSHNKVVEVHQAQATGSSGPLWYRTGILLYPSYQNPAPSSLSIKWGDSALYDNGTSPMIACAANSPWGLEVHQAAGYGDYHGFGPLWNRGYQQIPW